MSKMLSFNLDLGKRPHILQTGLCLHGMRPSESYGQHGLWSLHAYRYRGEMKLQGQTYPFRRNWVSLIPPERVVEWHFPKHAPHYYAHFAVKPSGRSILRVALLRDLKCGFERFCESFEQMIQYNATDPDRASIRLWDMLYQLDSEPAGQPPEHIHPHLQVALSLIRNQQAEKLSVDSLARAVGVSHNHLTTLFQKQFGQGVKRYIQQQRLNCAQRLLAKSSLSVKSIAIETGIPDLQYFSKLMRNETGMSPRAYRLLHQEIQPAKNS
jgi:AraC-like DNA-binding protein